MLDAFLAYLPLGNGFDEDDLKIAGVLVQLLKENGEKGFIIVTKTKMQRLQHLYFLTWIEMEELPWDATKPRRELYLCCRSGTFISPLA